MFRPYSPPKLVAYVLSVMLALVFIISLTFVYLLYLICVNWTSIISIVQLDFLTEPASEMLIYSEYQEQVTKLIGSEAAIAYLE